jgi:signal peptidase I
MRSNPIKTEKGPEIRLEMPDLLKRARFELSRHNPVQLRISGSTMRPSLEDGDLVTIEPVNSQVVRPGDIILYQSLSDTALIHRVVRLEQRSAGRYIVTRGDASATVDVPVPIHHIMGRVTSVNRAGEVIEVTLGDGGWRERVRRLLLRLGFNV